MWKEELSVFLSFAAGFNDDQWVDRAVEFVKHCKYDVESSFL